MPTRPLRIASRGSPMALRQTGLVRDRLAAFHPDLATPGAVEIVVVRTTGDRVQDRVLAEIGGKGLFTKEIDEALLDGRADLAVHSLKDVETWLPPGLEIACVLPRDDPRDALLSANGARLAELPAGARVGTASLRRQAQLLHRRPDLRILPVRGNVGTRIGKLEAGLVEALVLAASGLARLGESARAAEILPPEIMLPAVAQGALAIECRSGEAALHALLAPLHDPATALCVGAERAMLAALDGSCRTPVAALATLTGERLELRGMLLKPDGSAALAGRREGGAGEAAALGRDLGAELRRRGGPDFGLD